MVVAVAAAVYSFNFIILLCAFIVKWYVKVSGMHRSRLNTYPKWLFERANPKLRFAHGNWRTLFASLDFFLFSTRKCWFYEECDGFRNEPSQQYSCWKMTLIFAPLYLNISMPKIGKHILLPFEQCTFITQANFIEWGIQYFTIFLSTLLRNSRLFFSCPVFFLLFSKFSICFYCCAKYWFSSCKQIISNTNNAKHYLMSASDFHLSRFTLDL